jgi:arsenite transporter
MAAIWFETVFLKRFGPTTIVALLATLVLLFSFQGDVILSNPLHIVLIAVPLVIQTFAMFAIAYGWAKAWRVPHSVAAPAAMIGASNFFELAVATAIALFGVTSGAALAAVVGVLVEVPVMLVLVRIANATDPGPPADTTAFDALERDGVRVYVERGLAIAEHETITVGVEGFGPLRRLWVQGLDITM